MWAENFHQTWNARRGTPLFSFYDLLGISQHFSDYEFYEFYDKSKNKQNNESRQKDKTADQERGLCCCNKKKKKYAKTYKNYMIKSVKAVTAIK